MKAIIGKKGVGKTTILNELEKQGFSIFNCDEWIHAQYKNNSYLKKQFIEAFGKQVIINNEINRIKLKKIIINNPKAICLIMQLTHKTLLKELQANHYDFVEIPALAFSPIDFTSLFKQVFEITRDVFVDDFYINLSNPIRKICAIKITNNSVIESVKEILSK